MLLDLTNKSKYSAYIDYAVNSLKNGNIIGFPTETVYRLGANASNKSAIKN